MRSWFLLSRPLRGVMDSHAGLREKGSSQAMSAWNAACHERWRGTSFCDHSCGQIFKATSQAWQQAATRLYSSQNMPFSERVAGVGAVWEEGGAEPFSLEPSRWSWGVMAASSVVASAMSSASSECVARTSSNAGGGSSDSDTESSHSWCMARLGRIVGREGCGRGSAAASSARVAVMA
ncbi:MAG: hypothetical protein WDW36_009980 [Sanguina aurantia]